MSVYIGKRRTGSKSDVCRVIESDIATGNATVYNRATNRVEILTIPEKCTLWENLRKLAEDTESEYIEAERKAVKKYNKLHPENPLTSL